MKWYRYGRRFSAIVEPGAWSFYFFSKLCVHMSLRYWQWGFEKAAHPNWYRWQINLGPFCIERLGTIFDDGSL